MKSAAGFGAGNVRSVPSEIESTVRRHAGEEARVGIETGPITRGSLANANTEQLFAFDADQDALFAQLTELVAGIRVI